MTATFTSPFRPAVALYSGGAVDENVPWKYPVALNGRPYLLDLASNQMQRGFEPRVRESVDLGTVPGEASVSPEGMWRRSQATWWYGAGQRWADNADSIPGRFYQSCGVNVWEDGQLSLLPACSFSTSSSSGFTSALVISDGIRLYLAKGAAISYTTDWSGSFTDITGEGAQPVVAAATNGNHTWFVQGTAGVYRTVRGSDAATQVITSTTSNIGFVANRLLAAHDNHLYDITSLGYGSGHALPSALFTHANTDFRWVGFAASGTHIYAAGYSGGRSLIYKVTITAEGTSLGAPSVALELPPGEQVTALGDFPGGFILIGTSVGARLAASGANGDLTVGALIVTGSSVTAFTKDKSFVWFTWAATHPSGFVGLGRMDLRRLTAPLTPAYASDTYLPNVASPTSLSITRFDGANVIATLATDTIDSDAKFFRGNDKVGQLPEEGWLDTGSYVWGLPDPKIVPKVDIRSNPLPVSDLVRVQVSSDLAALQTCSCSAPTGATFLRFHPQQQASYRTDFRIQLRSEGSSYNPVVTRFNARAFASPARSQVLRVPLLLHHRINVNGTDLDQNVQFELLNLRGLVSSPQIVRYQEGLESFSVLVEDVVWVPRHEYVGPGQWDGTAVVTMRTIEV